jgi:hypothetical protein
MSQFPGQPQFGNSEEIVKALKNKNTLTSNRMKARLLKDIGAENKAMIGNQYFAKGSIIDVDVKDGSKIAFAPNLSTGKRNYPLTIGTDVELIKENEVKPIDITPQNKMQVRALRELNLGGRGIVARIVKKGEIFEISANQPLGGKTYYYEDTMAESKIPLVLGQDIELVTSEITKQQKGGLLFYGALAILGYIVYKVVTTK